MDFWHTAVDLFLIQAAKDLILYKLIIFLCFKNV